MLGKGVEIAEVRGRVYTHYHPHSGDITMEQRLLSSVVLSSLNTLR